MLQHWAYFEIILHFQESIKHEIMDLKRIFSLVLTRLNFDGAVPPQTLNLKPLKN